MEGNMRTQDQLVEIADKIEQNFREMDLEVQEVLMVLGLLNGFVYQTYTQMSMMQDEYICPECQKEDEILGKYEDKLGENNNGC